MYDSSSTDSPGSDKRQMAYEANSIDDFFAFCRVSVPVADVRTMEPKDSTTGSRKPLPPFVTQRRQKKERRERKEKLKPCCIYIEVGNAG